jgi:hypothetical protein
MFPSMIFLRKTEQYDPKTKTGGLFTDYVNTFLKMKQEASGWTEWCQSENDNWRYIRDYHEKEGIPLDYNNIKKNPGLRTLAKLMLNSVWGKFGQRSNMPPIKYISESAEYFDMLTSDQMLVMGINFVSNSHNRQRVLQFSLSNRTVPFHRNATLRRCAELHILSPMLSSIRP